MEEGKVHVGGELKAQKSLMVVRGRGSAARSSLSSGSSLPYLLGSL